MKRKFLIGSLFVFLLCGTYTVSATSLDGSDTPGTSESDDDTDTVIGSTEVKIDDDTTINVVVEMETEELININCSSINNLLDNVDHKHTPDRLKELWTFYKPDTSKLNDTTYSSGIPEGTRYFSNGDISGNDYLVKSRTYLVDNEILDRPTSVTLLADGTFKASRVSGDDYWFDRKDDALKTDLYTMLYKATYGVLDSRVLSTMKEDTVTGDLSYYYYTNATVYEAYLQSMLEKGIIVKSDLTAKELTGSSWDKRQSWDASQPALLVSEGSTQEDFDGVLGNSYSTEFAGATLTITPKKPAYFEEETVTLLEVLQIVEKFLRYTEKDMTETEASIVSYKYGITYLKELTEEEYATVAFLIAKGIINFEDKDLGFFEKASWSDVLPIVYRVANPDARYNFSVIQLTDGEAFWQSRGFSQDEFNLLFPNSEFILRTESIEETEEIESDTEDVVSRIMERFSVFAASSGTSEYKVVKDFDTVNSYYYKGIDIKELKDSKLDGVVVETGLKINGMECIRITFTVNAASATRAVQIVDDNLTKVIIDGSAYSISGVTKLDDDGHEIRMISQSVLKECFGSTIDIVEDKVLMNVKTGAMACLLQETGYALVGNQVFVNENILVTDTDNEIYYNLDVIASLLGLSIVDLYNNSVDTTRVATGAVAYNANLYSSSNTKTGSVEYLVGDAVSGKGDSAETLQLCKKSQDAKNPVYLYNLNQISNGINTVFRIYYEKFGTDTEPKPVIVVTDWVYAAPALSTFNNYGILKEETSSSIVTWNDVFNIMYTAPANGSALRSWWDSNISMSKGLTAMYFKQSRVEYVKSGYMMPRVTVLMPPETPSSMLKDESISDMLVGFGFSVPQSYGTYYDGTTHNFVKSYFKDLAGLNGSDAGMTAIRSFAKQYRSFKVIKGSYYNSTTGISYGTDFFLDSSQILYRNLDEDSDRFDYVTSSDKTLQKIVTRDRVANSSEVAPTGSEVTYTSGKVTKKFLYRGVVTKSDNNGNSCQYLDLIPIYDGVVEDLPVFTVNTGTGDKSSKYSISFDKTYNNNNSKWSKVVISKFYKTFGITQSVIDEDFWLSDVFSSDYGSELFVRANDVAKYYRNFNLQNYVLSYSSAGTIQIGKATTSKWENAVIADKSKCYAIPHVYLPAGNYYIYRNNDSWTVGSGKTGYLLNHSSVYYSGIVDGVIDAIISKYVKTTEIGNLDNGTTLLIGDTKWKKIDDYWCSYPIKNPGVASIASQNANRAAKAFNKCFSTFIISCDGVDMPLTNYIRSVTLSSELLDKLSINEVCVSVDKKGNVTLVKRTKNGTKVVRDSAVANYTAFKAKFDPTLLVRPLTSDGSVYKVCNSASERVISGVQIPFFTEDLNFDSEDNEAFTLSQTGYEQTASFNAEKEEFSAEYTEKWFEDFQTLAFQWVIGIASYLLIINWATYLGVTQGACLWLLEAIAGYHPGKGCAGVDLVRILSLGIYKIDSPPRFSRVFVVTVICLIIDGVCINFI